MTPEMPRKLQKCDVFLAHPINYSKSAPAGVGKTNDVSPGASELPLKRMNPLDRRVKVLLEKFFQNVHEYGYLFTKISSLV